MASVKDIANSLVEGDDSLQLNSLVIPNHLSQMKLFGIRQGIELLPVQDDEFDTRFNFIIDVWRQNKIDLFLDKIWDSTLLLGKSLLYLRPTKKGGYRFYYYNRNQFRDYYNDEGDLIEVVIIYSYNVRNRYQDAGNGKHWVKLKITPESVFVSKSNTMMSFDDEFSQFTSAEEYTNSLGFIPCVVIKNRPTGSGSDGEGEFDWIASQLEKLDLMEYSLAENLEFFGNPSLVTTRSPQETTEALESESANLSRNRTLSSAGGWYGSQLSTKKQDPFSYRGGTGIRVKRVVGNVQPDERFGYISPDPVTPDHAQFVREYREAIHFALGGIDERGISANATAYEVKGIYGRVSTTAMKKARAIYTYGFCSLFEMAIAAEEDLFKRSLAIALKKDVSEITMPFISNLMGEGKIPPGVVGLPPLGKREISWRWTGPVFERSPRDIQLASIVARNMQELGVRSLDALKTVFEDKTDKELKGMLEGGYPFRYMSSVASTTQQLLSLYQQTLSVPSQQDPNVPMGMFVPFQPLVNKSIETLYRELNYAPEFKPVQPGDPPDYRTGQSNFDQFQSAISSAGQLSNAAPIPGSPATAGNSIPGLSPGTSPLAAAGINPYTIDTAGYPVNAESLEGSVQFGGRLPEFASGIPTPGTTTTTPANPQSQQPVLSRQLPGSVPPDLAVDAARPGSIWQQLFPNFATAIQPKPKRSRKK